MTLLEEAVQAYREVLLARHRSPRTLAHFTRQARHFQVSTGLSLLTDLKPNTVERYLLELLESPISAATAWCYLGRLLPFFRWLSRWRHLLIDPGGHLQWPRFPESRPRLLSVAQVECLLEQPSQTTALGLRDLALLELLYGTGLRRAECAQLDLADYDRSGALLWVRRGKGGRARQMPVGAHLAAVLEVYLESARPQLALPAEAALFVSVQGTRLSYDRLGQRVFIHGRRAGLGRVTPHSLRHAFASHLLENGAQLHQVRSLLGHTNVQATEIYARLVPQTLMAEYRRTHPRATR